MDQRTMPAYLTLGEAATHLGIGRTTVYQEVVAGRIRAKRFGKKNIRIAVSELERYEAEQDYHPTRYR